MSKTIVIVEDDKTLQGLYKERLELDGIKVHATGDGKDGLEKVRKILPDLVLLDINLPGMSGVDILDEIKGDERTRAIPVIMLTALTDNAIADKCEILGADEMLVKPFNTPKQVLDKVKEHI